MKKSYNNFKNSFYPSVLGADRLWDNFNKGSDELISDIIAV